MQWIDWILERLEAERPIKRLLGGHGKSTGEGLN